MVITLYQNKNSIFEASKKLYFNDWVLLLICTFVIMVFHEFGHATSAKKLGAEPDNIGFGFYLLRPVMFADVSDVWKLKPKERIYVNFAGLYIEVIIASLLCLAFLITKNSYLLLIVSAQTASFFMNLNPFFRYDGYWVLSDATNTPNLRKVSTQKVYSFFKTLVGKEKITFSSKTIFLIIYGLISNVLIFVFLGWILIKNPNSLISFPFDVYNYIKLLVTQEISFSIGQLFKFTLPFIFYFMVIRVFGKRILKYLKSFIGTFIPAVF